MTPVLAALVLALATRLVYLFVRYTMGYPATGRHHVESAAALFVAAGIVLKLWQNRRSVGEGAVEAFGPMPVWMWLAFCAAALALYWRALSLGFLSDDFVLIDRAANWDLRAVQPALFRPLPILLWAVVLHSGAGAVTIHLINVLLHGTNAFLASSVAAGWVSDRRWSVLAGLLFLASPLALEAVVWCSGVFDLSATALILTSVLLARRYERGPSVATRVLLVVAGLAAVLSKESAAVGPVLVLLDAWIRRTVSRKLLTDVAVLFGLVALFASVRLAAEYGVTAPSMSKYLVQRVVFETFGGLAVPWHSDVIRSVPWLAILGVLIVVSLLAVFFLSAGSRRRTKLAIGAALWIIIPVVPVISFFDLAADLQASRYLYLSFVGWAGLIVVLATSERAASRLVGAVRGAAVATLLAIGAFGAVVHLGPWQAAAARRDDVLSAARTSERMRACGVVTLRDLPDSVRGAYVFRNGGPEAFARDLGLRASVGEGNGPCVFHWHDGDRRFVPAGIE